MIGESQPSPPISIPVRSSTDSSSSTEAKSSSSSSSSSSFIRDLFFRNRSSPSSDADNPFPPLNPSYNAADIVERGISAACAAFFSAIIVNPLDVVKTRLQAQAANEPYHHLRHISLSPEFVCPPVCPRGGVSGIAPLCPPSCFRYNSTFDVFGKIIRQEGVLRLWRGTNAGLALAVPTVGIYLPCYDLFRDCLEGYATNNCPQLTPYAPLIAGSIARSLACIICSPIELARVRMQAQREFRSGVKPPGMLKTMLEVLSRVTISSGERMKGVTALWTGAGAQLARDVPFSAICWATLEPLRRRFIESLGSETNATNIVGANFAAGYVAGSIAAAATCPLDVAKTRRQIQDPLKVARTSTWQVLAQVWRQGGISGLFMGVVPRVARAGPSVGIVISFYEVMKYTLHQAHCLS